jgi:hypothetical protein
MAAASCAWEATRGSQPTMMVWLFRWRSLWVGHLCSLFWRNLWDNVVSWIFVAGMERPPHTREGSPTVDEARSPRVMVARSRCFHSVRWLALMQWHYSEKSCMVVAFSQRGGVHFFDSLCTSAPICGLMTASVRFVGGWCGYSVFSVAVMCSSLAVLKSQSNPSGSSNPCGHVDVPIQPGEYSIFKFIFCFLSVASQGHMIVFFLVYGWNTHTIFWGSLKNYILCFPPSVYWTNLRIQFPLCFLLATDFSNILPLSTN